VREDGLDDLLAPAEKSQSFRCRQHRVDPLGFLALAG
jgi:hypothetical protein